MNAQEMMKLYCEENGLAMPAFDAWQFGTDADLLAELVLQGKKTATSSLYEWYKNDVLSQAGDYSVVLDSRNEAVCIIRTTAVYVCAFHKVAPLHAAKEGEGNGSLAYWRAVHEAFFTEELQAVGKVFSGTVPIVCEEFELLYPKRRINE